MREKARKSRTFKKDEEGHSVSVWNHRILDINSTQKSDPLFEKRVTSITKAQQSFISIHGGIPCNLAPAHFTVHVVQVRLNFALGFVVEANPLFETGFSPGCPFFSFDFSSRSASTMRKREAGNPSRSASTLASSALLSICCVHKRRSLSAAASAPGRMDFLSPKNTIVKILDFTRFSL